MIEDRSHTRVDDEGPLAVLRGARIDRVDLPEPDLLALATSLGAQRVVLLLSFRRGLVAVGGAPERPRGAPCAGFGTTLRTHLTGARITDATLTGTSLAISLERAPHQYVLALEPTPNVALARDDRLVATADLGALRGRGLNLGVPWTAPTAGRAPRVPGSLDALLTEGERLLEARAQRDHGESRQALARALSAEARRLARRLEAIAGDLAHADEATLLRATASALLARLSELPRDAAEVTLEAASLSGGAPTRVTLPPGVSPSAHAQALFARAKKLETGLEIARARHDEASARRAAVLALAREVEDGDATLEVLTERLAALGLAPRAAPRERAEHAAERLPYRRFLGAGERPILVGRGGADNDALTTEHARRHDLWLHARGLPGAHVVVPLAKGEACPSELLVDAATLAAHFSDAADEPTVEVQHTPRRFVRKPRGSAPGAVQLEREKTLLLRVEPARLARLLATGQGPR